MAQADIHNRERWRQLVEQAGYRLGGLPKLAGVCRRHLQRYIRAAFGCSLRQWLDQERLEAAPEVLRKFRCVKIAADKLGFKQASHFSRKFKDYYGYCPMAYLASTDFPAQFSSSPKPSL